MLTKNHYLKRVTAILTIVTFAINCLAINSFAWPAYAQTISPAQANLNAISPAANFKPVVIRGINLIPKEPLKFNFLVEKGSLNSSDDDFKQESNKLIKYFLAALTIPDKEKWVNLSPYEPERIIPKNLGATEMGKELLSQDYLLKQLTSSLMNPDDELGKEFWARVYAKAQQEFGSTDIPLNTYNKIWIVPSVAKVYEHKQGAFILKSYLKVMLEEDYLAISGQRLADSVKTKTLSAIRYPLTAPIIKEILIPEIEKEVNDGKLFAPLRQIYSAVILASWYKEALGTSLLGKVYVNQNKTLGVETKDKKMAKKIQMV